jgi:hypothetical protein
MEDFNEANSGQFLQNELTKGEMRVNLDKEDSYDSCDCESAPTNNLKLAQALTEFKGFQLLQFELDTIMNALSVTEKALVDKESGSFTQIEVSTIRGDVREELTNRLITLVRMIPRVV